MTTRVIGPLTTAQVDQFWHGLAPGFQRCIDRGGGDLTLAELWQGCRRGDWFLLVAHEGDTILGASIWRPQVWQDGMKLRCLGLFGTNFKKWADDMRTVATAVARDCGATAFVTDGRPGWARFFPKAKVLRIVYEEQI